MPETRDLDSRLKALELWKDEATALLHEIRDAVVGSRTGKEPGLHEEIRHLKDRVGFLERVMRWVGSIASAILTALLLAWLALNGVAHK